MAKKAAQEALMETMNPKQREAFSNLLKMRRMHPETEEPMSEDKKSDCTDGEHCPEFKQIGEDELLTYLKAGWMIEHNLANGSVIIRREQA